MTTTNPGAVLITGLTGGLGWATALAMANRPASGRPDLLFVGREGEALVAVADEARAAGANVQALGCDLSRLSQVRVAADKTKELLASGQVRPLRGLIANAGMMNKDTRTASADGYELTFAVNYLAHAQLIEDLLDSFATPARIVLVGSNTYHANLGRKILRVQPAQWRDPIDLAQPATNDTRPSLKAAGVAYSNSKLAILYFAARAATASPRGNQRLGFRARGYARNRSGPTGRSRSRAHRPRNPTAARRRLPGQVRTTAGVNRPRPTLGEPARRRLRRPRQATAGETLRQ